MNYPTDSEMFTVACLVNTPAWLIPEQAKKATQDLFTDDRAAIVMAHSFTYPMRKTSPMMNQSGSRCWIGISKNPASTARWEPHWLSGYGN